MLPKPSLCDLVLERADNCENAESALTLLHSERPKLSGVLAVLSAIGLRMVYVFKSPLSWTIY